MLCQGRAACKKYANEALSRSSTQALLRQGTQLDERSVTTSGQWKTVLMHNQGNIREMSQSLWKKKAPSGFVFRSFDNHCLSRVCLQKGPASKEPEMEDRE